MKIIKVDNFGRDSVSDELVAENVSQFYGEAITDFLIDRFSGASSSDFFRLVPDDYKLYHFEP